MMILCYINCGCNKAGSSSLDTNDYNALFHSALKFWLTAAREETWPKKKVVRQISNNSAQWIKNCSNMDSKIKSHFCREIKGHQYFKQSFACQVKRHEYWACWIDDSLSSAQGSSFASWIRKLVNSSAGNTEKSLSQWNRSNWWWSCFAWNFNSCNNSNILAKDTRDTSIRFMELHFGIV